MISVEINNQDLKDPISNNRAGAWVFAITHINGKPTPLEERIFTATGTWQEAKEKAQGHARIRGCVEHVDSILLLSFSTE